MKTPPTQSSITEQMMRLLRRRLKVPVTVLMLACNLAWSVPSYGDVTLGAEGNTATRVVRLTTPNGAANLRVGMLVEGSGIQSGTYISQILTGDQVLLSHAVNGTAFSLTFRDVAAVTETPGGDYTKTGTGQSLLIGKDLVGGTLQMTQGTVQLGGVTYGGQSYVSGILADSTRINFDTTNKTVLNFGPNTVNYQGFERIGSINGGAGVVTETTPPPNPVNVLVSKTTINLTGENSSYALAVGSDNTDSVYNGAILGDINSMLIKEGTGRFTWNNDFTSAMSGVIRVESGTLVIGGSVGMNVGVRMSLSNKADTVLELNSTNSQTVSSLTGGGRGAITNFSNGKLGALGGAYLNGSSAEIRLSGNRNLTLDNAAVNAYFGFGGNITGQGGFVKNGPNLLELFGDNTYTGSTTVQAGTTDNSNSVLRLGAYGPSTGVGSLANSGYGSLPSTTRLLIAAGGSGTSRNATFDLNGATQTLSALLSSNASGTRNFLFNTGTLNLNTVSESSSNFDGTFVGRGTINVVNTMGEDGWTLSGNSNATQRGALNILGGQVTLGRNGGTLGDAVHVKVSTGGTLNVAQTDTIGSLSGSGSVQIAGARRLVLSAAPAGGILSSGGAWSGTITGSGGLELAAGASLRLTTAQSYIGGTYVNSGSALHLDYGSGPTTPSLIPGVLNLRGGNVFVYGQSAQTVSNTNITGGATTIYSDFNGAATLGMANITRGTGGALHVHGNALKTSVANVNGIIGGWATHLVMGSGGNPEVSWAVADGANPVKSLATFDTDFQAVGGLSGKNMQVTTAAASLSTDNPIQGPIGSLYFNANQDINLTIGGLDGTQRTIIESGGILVSPTVGSRSLVIKGKDAGTVLTGGAGGAFGVSNELIVHQHNTRGTLTIDATISDNTDLSGGLSLTKTGMGKLILTRTNDYTGQTSILGGVLELANQAGGPEFGTLGGTEELINHGYLSFNINTGLGVSYAVGNIISGTGAVRQMNANGSVILSAANTYTGPTQVLAGTLGISNAETALGSTAGLTTVSTSYVGTVLTPATLELRGVGGGAVPVSETVVLEGGTLSAAVGNSALGGNLILTRDATVNSTDSNASLTLAGTVLAYPGKTLNVTSSSGGGLVILANAQNQLGNIVLGDNAGLQIGNNSAGYAGRGIISTGTGSRVITNTNNQHMVLAAKITGGADYYHVRNIVYLTADNDYTGRTLVGGNGVGTPANFNADLRVGTGTYTGNIGTGNVIIQAPVSEGNTTFGDTLLRTDLIGNRTWANNIAINPSAPALGVRNAFLHRNGLGTLTLTGTVTAGVHNADAQRAILQTEGGGKLVVTGQLVNGENNAMNLVNNGTFVLAGSQQQDLWGVLSGGGVFTFKAGGDIVLKGVNTATGNHYIQKGKVIVDNNSGTNGSGLGITDNSDLYLSSGAKLQFNYNETIGALGAMKGSEIILNNGSKLTLNDGVTMGIHGDFSGDGTLIFGNTATSWYGMFGNNSLTSDAFIGAGTSTITVRVNNLTNSGEVSSLGRGSAINLGVASGVGESRLEYIGAGQETDRQINIAGAGGSTARIAGSGKGALVLNGDIVLTTAGNKTLHLHGQTKGNTLNGKIDEAGEGVLSLVINSSAGNNDMYGLGHWILTNDENNFRGKVTVNLGVLELAGDLGDGTGTSSVFGNLAVDRVVSLGTGNFDGRKFDVFSGGDNLGGASGLGSTGSLVFNDPNEGVAVLSNKINFVQEYNSTTNPGWGELVNNGAKVVVMNGKFTVADNGARNWVLDGTNMGTTIDDVYYASTIAGVISDTASTSNVVSLLKEGSGVWRLTGDNTYEGTTTIARGTLELAAVTGSTVHDNSVINLSNAGSDGSSVGGATLRIVRSETIGGLQGAVGSFVDIVGGQTLTVQSASQTFNGVITGGGNFTRTNNDGTTRETTFTNKHTYTGVTTITSAGSNAGLPRINVLFLANGGEASGIGAGSSSAANLVLSAGTTGGGLRWIGTTNQSTDRLFTLGAGAGAAAIWADGQVLGNDVPTISFTNTGALAFTGTGNRTLTLRGSNRGDNLFAPSINDSGSGVTSLAKSDVGAWVLAGNNSFTGTVTINAGTLAVTSNTALGSTAGGVEIKLASNDSTSFLDLRGVTITGESLTMTGGNNNNFIGLSASQGTNVWTGSIANNTSALYPVAAGASLDLRGILTGSATFTKLGNGTLILSANNTRTGTFAARGGIVALDYSTNNGSKLSDGNTLLLGASVGTGFFRGPNDTNRGQEYLFNGTGVTIDLRGGSHTEIVSGTTLDAGASAIIRSSGSSILRMNTITRAANTGGTLDFGAAGIAQVDNTNTANNGIIGGWATLGKTNWAINSTNAGDGLVGALATYGTNWASTVNTTVMSNMSVSGATNTVRFNNAAANTINLTAAASITTGGILVTPNVGANNVAINGNDLTAGSNDIIVHQHNTLGSLTIGARITGASGLTKSGLGDLYILGDNTNTGVTYVNEGNLYVGNGGATGQLGTGAANIVLNGKLIFNSTHGATFDQKGNLRGNGDFILAETNTRTIHLSADNVNFTGRFIVEGGTLAASSSSNSLGSSRITTTVNKTGTLELRGISQGISLFLNDSGTLSTTAGNNTISGTLNITGNDTRINVGSGTTLTLSNLIYSTTGMTKYGNGLLTVSANQFQEQVEGSTTAVANPSFRGQFRIMEGEVRLGNIRALGDTGVGNETVVMSGATLDLRGNALNWADDASLTREIIQISGDGVGGLGSLRNTSGLGVISGLGLNGDATISGGSFNNSSRLVVAGFDTNVNTGSTLTGNFTRGEAEIAGNNRNLTIIGNSTANDGNGVGVTFRDPKFLSALNSINVKEGVFRIDMEADRTGASFAGLTAANVTNGITVGYSGPTLADYTNATLGLGPNVGARLNFYRNWNTEHSVNITLDGVTAKANSGYNYIDTGVDATMPNPRTYLSGTITLLGDADRNIFHIDASNGQQTIGEQGNLTGAIQSKLIVNGVLSGPGGFTKTGARELRLTQNNTFTGAMNVLRSITAAVPWQDNKVTINGIEYQTFGDAEGRAEWGVTLSGLNGAISGTSAVNLQRRGLVVLDNTTRLDRTSDLAHLNGDLSVVGGYNGDRINDAADINYNHGWLKIFGSPDVMVQNENLATLNGARMNVLSGTNTLDIIPADGANTFMSVTIGEIRRLPGSVLQINALDSTTRFSNDYYAGAPTDTVAVYLNSIGNLTQVGAGTVPGSKDKSVIVGLFGGIMPHQYLSDARQLGYNNAGASDYLNQGRNQQYISAGHFMTYDASSGLLRPLDDSEYFTPADGLIDTLNGSAGKNINLMDNYTIVRQNTTINSLRFGPLSDVNGSGGAINNTTTLTDLPDGQALFMYVDGTLRISSGMISSANFTTANTNNLTTLILGGTLNFGSREAIINNQNALMRTTDGVIATGNLEIRSSIAGSGGLTKTGISQVVLDGFNTYTGVTTVSNGYLMLRNGRQALGASGPGNGVVIEGNGNLYSEHGIQIGSANAYEDILVKAQQGNQYVFRVNQDVTNFFGRLIVDNVDQANQTLFSTLVRLDNSASAIMNGDIYGGPSSVSNDIVAIDSRVLQFEGAGSNNYIFRGQFGDRGDANGNAISIADPISTLPSLAGVRTNENEVLRVNFSGAADTNYILEQQYNAAGRLTLVQGTMLVSYDPNDPNRDGNGFWTDTAISKIPGATSLNAFGTNGNTSQHGFTMGTSSNGNSSLFLTRDGQNFNMSSWTTTGTGFKFIGGINESGTVSFGTPTATGTLASTGTNGLRLYAANGGTVVFDHVLTGAPGTAPNNLGFTKVGLGTVVLKNTSGTAASSATLDLSGGKLVLDYRGGTNLMLLGGGNTAFGGGTLEVISRENDASGMTFATGNNILQLQMGGTELVTRSTNGNSVAINLANLSTNATKLTREVGALLNLVDLGNPLNVFTMAVSAVSPVDTALPWATYSNTEREADDFAMIASATPPSVTFTGTTSTSNSNLTGVSSTAGLSVGMVLTGSRISTSAPVVITRIEGNVVTMSAAGASSGSVTVTATVKNRVGTYTRVSADYLNNVAGWVNGQNISETSGGVFTGSVTVDRKLSTLRFDSSQNSTVTIAGGTTLAVGSGTAGAILVSSNTGTADKTITGGFLTSADGSPELILHQYGKGNLTIGSTITGNISLTVNGPSTTASENFDTTGIVRLTGTNTYTGKTLISGGVLEISNPAALGPDPITVDIAKVVLNGGTLRWTGETASLGNRGVTIDGNGGVFDVVNPSGNLVVGTALTGTQEASDGTPPTAATITSQQQYRGDLIKKGAGSLTMLGNSSLQGLVDIREGSLIVMADNAAANAGTTTVLGSSRSVADGTILRDGANLQVFLGNGNNGGEWNIEEYITFEGNNTFTYGGFLDINADLSTTLGQVFNMGNRRPLNMNGVIDVKGTTTFNVTAEGILRLNNNAGYLTGSGDIVKDGVGQLHFRANQAEWKGNLIIKQGAVYAANQADVLGTGYMSGKTITLGDVERQGTAELLIQNPDGVNGWVYDINHDINVVYNPAQTKRLGIDNISNGSYVAYNGDVTLNDSLILLLRDTGISAGGEHSYVNFNGSFKDGTVTSGNLVIQTDDNDTGVNNRASNRSFGYAVLNGDNSAWTGDVTISTNIANGTASGYNQDNTTILRLGNSKALTAANDVTMNYNSILQAGGQNVTIGNLITKGGDGQFYGDSGTMTGSGTAAVTNGSSEVIENASTTAANLTIQQNTPVTFEASWDAFFRDGTQNSQFVAPGANVLQPSAALSITKAGPGWATLTLDNDYSGTTYVNGGILQVGRNGIGDTGSSSALGTIVNAGGILAGSGIVQGRLSILADGALRAGDSAGQDIGTLTVNGDVIFSSGSQALMQVRAASFNNPGAVMESDSRYTSWLNSIVSGEFANAINDLVTNAQHDMVAATGNISLAYGTKIVVQSDGYTPKAGDVFSLFNGSTYSANVNVGNSRRYGNESDPTLDLILFALGGNLLWDVSLFNQYGLLVVVEGDVAATEFDAPSFDLQPTSNQSQTEALAPGTSVTLSALASSGGENGTITYQWMRNNTAVPGANSKDYTFNASYATKGVYTVSASNNGGTTTATGSVTVLVQDLPGITTHPASGSVSPNGSYTFTVAADGEPTLSYQWYKDNEPLGTASTNPNLVLTEITEDDEGVYYVVVSNSAGSDTSTSATLTVLDDITNIVVTMNPTETYAGQDITFTATHDGDGPFTYEWLRNGGSIPGANQSSFVLRNAQQTGPETIVVRIKTGNNTTFASDPVVLTLRGATPVLVSAPVAQTVLTGSPLDLKVTATGRPVLRYVWKKDGKVLGNAVTPDISTSSARITDGGNYTVEVSNTAGQINTTAAPAVIVVVDGTSRLLPVQSGAKATFTANVGANKKTPITYEWRKVSTVMSLIDPGPDGEEGTEDDIYGPVEVLAQLNPNDPRIDGINEKELEIDDTVVGDEGTYRCIVTAPGGTVTGCEHVLRLYTEPPQFDAGSEYIDTVAQTITFPSGLVGRSYQFQIPVDRSDTTKSPDKITASGLPKGLTVDPISGLISGVPAAVKDGGYKVTVTLANKLGKVAYKGTLLIEDLAETVTGVWVATVDRNSSIGGNLGGRVDLTVTDKATYSGKLTLGATSYSFKGILDVEGSSPRGTVVINQKGKPVPPPLTLAFELNPNNNTIRTGTITDGSNTVNFEGWRHIYSKLAPATSYTGYYTMSIGLSPSVLPEDNPDTNGPAVGDKDLPLGIGYATFTVAADGKLKVAGKMPDGEKISLSSFVGPNGEIGIYQLMYKSLKPGGSLHGRMVIDDQDDAQSEDPLNSENSLTGNTTWVRPAATKAGARYFAKGFGIPGAPYGTPVALIISGGRYDPPAEGEAVLNIIPPEEDEPAVNNSRVEFTHGGDIRFLYYIGSDPFFSRNPNVDLAVLQKSKVIVLDTTINRTDTSLKVNAKTGLVTGSFNARDFNPRFPEIKPDIVARKVSFQGVLINEGGEQFAVGYFLLPQLPANATSTEPATTSATSPYYSGRFEFFKKP